MLFEQNYVRIQVLLKIGINYYGPEFWGVIPKNLKLPKIKTSFLRVSRKKISRFQTKPSDSLRNFVSHVLNSPS